MLPGECDDGEVTIRGRGLFRRTPLIELTEDGVVLEGHDVVAWAELDDAGVFTNDLASGLGLRLVDPEPWFTDRTVHRFSVVGSVLVLDRQTRGLGDLMGYRTQRAPSDLDRRIEWARGITGGWDLTINQDELDVPAAEAAESIRGYRATIIG